MKDILKATLNLLRNKTFMFASLGLSIELLFGAALVGFFAKVVILKFGGSISEVALYSGVVFLPSSTSRLSLLFSLSSTSLFLSFILITVVVCLFSWNCCWVFPHEEASC